MDVLKNAIMPLDVGHSGQLLAPRNKVGDGFMITAAYMAVVVRPASGDDFLVVSSLEDLVLSSYQKSVSLRHQSAGSQPFMTKVIVHIRMVNHLPISTMESFSSDLMNHLVLLSCTDDVPIRQIWAGQVEFMEDCFSLTRNIPISHDLAGFRQEGVRQGLQLLLNATNHTVVKVGNCIRPLPPIFLSRYSLSVNALG